MVTDHDQNLGIRQEGIAVEKLNLEPNLSTPPFQGGAIRRRRMGRVSLPKCGWRGFVIRAGSLTSREYPQKKPDLKDRAYPIIFLFKSILISQNAPGDHNFLDL